MEGATSERREASERRARAERRSAAERRGDGSPAVAPVKQQQSVPPARKVSDREKLEELVRTLSETLPNVTNFLASATQHARACQKGDLLMQALRARAVFGTLAEAVRDGEAHVKDTQSRRA